MKALLVPEKVFTLQVNGADFPNMRQVSIWEGFIKLEGPGGTAILGDCHGGYARSLDDAYSRPRFGWVVLSASGAILETLRAVEPAP